MPIASLADVLYVLRRDLVSCRPLRINLTFSALRERAWRHEPGDTSRNADKIVTRTQAVIQELAARETILLQHRSRESLPRVLIRHLLQLFSQPSSRLQSTRRYASSYFLSYVARYRELTHLEHF